MNSQLLIATVIYNRQRARDAKLDTIACQFECEHILPPEEALQDNLETDTQILRHVIGGENNKHTNK